MDTWHHTGSQQTDQAESLLPKQGITSAKEKNTVLMSLYSLLTCTPLLSSLSLGRLTTGCFPQFKAILKKRAGARGWQRRFDSSPRHTQREKIFHIKGKDWEKKITEIST